MKLSLMVHANRNRGDRVQCLLTRLSLNAQEHPDIPFEIVLFDGGSTDHTKDLCEHFAKFMNLKYVYCPLEGPTDESYPLSIMSRLCEGEFVGFVSADHWISEHLIHTLTLDSLPGCDQINFITGAVCRAEDTKVHKSPVQIVDALLHDKCSDKYINSIVELAQLEPYESMHPEVWSVRRELLPDFSGDWINELTNLDGDLHESARHPLAIDMWAPPQDFVEAPEDFGVLPEYGFTEINGVVRGAEETEEYIEQLN